jgi:hypothetical protein
MRMAGRGDIFRWGGRVFNLYTAIHIHIRDYIYYCALTVTFLMETNQVIKARSTLSQYFRARDIWEREG